MARRKYYTGKSGIHGTGVFAARKIARGELIGVFKGDPTDTDGEHVLWVERDDWEYVGLKGGNDLRFVNHSRRPNAEFDGQRLYARRGLRPHEEITFHYGPDWEDVP